MPTRRLNGDFLTNKEVSELGFLSVGERVSISRHSVIIGCENIKIGNHVRIDPFTVIVANEGYLKLGSYIHIAGGCHLSCIGGISMADFSGLAHGVKLYSGSDIYDGSVLTNPTVPKRLTNIEIGNINLGRHVIVGCNSVIMPNITLNDGVSVGAMSFVRKDLDAWCIYSGTPLRKVGSRSKKLLELEKLV